ncbi:LysR family transcriptional regulator [Mesorhizobium abyssinicae]|uniref:LysR family transcriptional regulator n=1 Tax=Mesorhizobium abyssinicae TaxID=1209958 RepID=A0ABU5AX64_9HYPH|nr:LysR family transcriptional regulator [Mesorhizobium abyssinicae]MDX8541889.1 LysR family transcriptional regulator [Mesorhizobium abyssinicae]
MKNYHRLPPLNSLRAFEATARQGSITRAAEELGVTQSAVSHQIKTLENYTGVALLERRGNSFTLTPAGQRTMSSLGEGFDLIADAIAQLDTPEIRGEVVVSCPPALTALWLVKEIGPLLLEYPGITLSLRSSSQWKAVIGSDVDLCIRYGNGTWENRRTTLLSEVDLFPVCSPSVAAGLRTTADLKNIPLLYAIDDNEWDSWLTSVDINERPRMRHYMGNEFAMIEASVNGFGVAMGDSVTCRHYLDSGMLIAPFKKSKKSNFSFYLIEKSGLKKKAAVTCVRDWIVKSFATMNNG